MGENLLFIVFICIFIATALITLLGLIHVVQIDEPYLKGLFSALLLEVIGCIIVLFKIYYLNTDYRVFLVSGEVKVEAQENFDYYFRNGIFDISIKPEQAFVNDSGQFDFYLIAQNRAGKCAIPKLMFSYTPDPYIEKYLAQVNITLDADDPTPEDKSYQIIRNLPSDHRIIKINDVTLHETSEYKK